MLIFEITKTNTPLPQKGLAPILIALPHTYVAYATQAMISSVKQSKTMSLKRIKNKIKKIGPVCCLLIQAGTFYNVVRWRCT